MGRTSCIIIIPLKITSSKDCKQKYCPSLIDHLRLSSFRSGFFAGGGKDVACIWSHASKGISSSEDLGIIS